MNRRNALLLLLLLPYCLLAQPNTQSPYSYFGLGEFDLSAYGKNSGMAGVAYGLRSAGFVNHLNPASYAGFDSLRVVLDVSASGKLSRLSTLDNSHTGFNGNIKRIALGLRLHRMVAVSLGITPYTNVGYTVHSSEPVVGLPNDYAVATYSGDGGLSRVYLGTSFRPIKNLSVGVNVSMIFGYINRSKSTSHSLVNATWTEKFRYKPNSSYLFDFGAQYTIKLPNKTHLTLGAITGLNSKVNMTKYFSITTGLEGDEEKRDVETFHLPLRIGGGISLTTARWTIAADYETQRWSSMISKNRTTRFQNTHRAAVGVGFCPNYYLGRNILQRMTYQAGLHYERLPLLLHSQRQNAYGITLGLDMPFRQNLSTVAFSVDFGTQGRASHTLIRENYIKFNLGISFSDFWFLKPQYD